MSVYCRSLVLLEYFHHIGYSFESQLLRTLFGVAVCFLKNQSCFQLIEQVGVDLH